jgi:L-fuconolactonase
MSTTTKGRAAPLNTMLFDTHAHFFTDDVERYPLHGASKSYLGPEKLRATVLANPTNVERMLGWWDENQVTAGVGVQYRSAYGVDNSYLLDVCALHYERIVPVVILDASDADAPKTLRELARTRGASGVRLTGYQDASGCFPWLNSTAALATWAVADEMGLTVVLMHLPPGTSAPALGPIAEVARKFPSTRIVLDHVGWPAHEAGPNFGLSPAHRLLKDHPNIYYKLTTHLLKDFADAGISTAQFVRHCVDTYGADHLMWGSDVGNTPGTYAELVGIALDSMTLLTNREKQQVLHDTGKESFVRGGRR